MQDSVSEEHPDELDATQDDLITTTFNFTFKTYLFAGTETFKLVKPKVISSFMSSYVDAEVVKIPANKIDDFQKKYPNASVSATVLKNVTRELTAMVDNPDVSSTTYSDVPIINKIDFGLYVVPGKHDIPQYIQSVDNGDFGLGCSSH